MNRNKKWVTGLAASTALLLAAVLVIGAAAAPDPFRGKWHSEDIDGSYQTLEIGGGPSGTYHIRFYDAGATACEPPVDGVWPFAARAMGNLTASGLTISETLTVYCMESPPVELTDHLFSYTYDSGTDTLLDSDGVTWFH